MEFDVTQDASLVIDMGMGMGAGVVDRPRQLNLPGVLGVEFGGAADGGARIDEQSGR